MSLATKIAFPFACTKCGEGFGTFAPKCPTCGKGVVARVRAASLDEAPVVTRTRPTFLRIDAPPPKRLPTGLAAFDLALGGGFVAEGVTYILTGTPGAGKSTLALWAAEAIEGAYYFAAEGARVMWDQLASRTGRGQRVPFFFKTSIDEILDIARAERPPLIIVDQIHALEPRDRALEYSKRLIAHAEEYRSCVFALGEHAKDGSVRGSGSVEYAYDVTMLLEAPAAYDPQVPGEIRTDRKPEDAEARWLTTKKNRYGPAGTWKMRLGAQGWVG